MLMSMWLGLFVNVVTPATVNTSEKLPVLFVGRSNGPWKYRAKFILTVDLWR